MATAVVSQPDFVFDIGRDAKSRGDKTKRDVARREAALELLEQELADISDDASFQKWIATQHRMRAAVLEMKKRVDFHPPSFGNLLMAWASFLTHQRAQGIEPIDPTIFLTPSRIRKLNRTIKAGEKAAAMLRPEPFVMPEDWVARPDLSVRDVRRSGHKFGRRSIMVDGRKRTATVKAVNGRKTVFIAERERMRWVPYAVFDISQTEVAVDKETGEPLEDLFPDLSLPEFPLTQEADLPQWVGRGLAEWVREHGFDLEVSLDAPGWVSSKSAEGVCSNQARKIWIRGVPGDEEPFAATQPEGVAPIRTLAHEACHTSRLSPKHSEPGFYQENRGRCEAEAELGAWMLALNLGYRLDRYTAGYVSSWNGRQTDDGVDNDTTFQVVGEVFGHVFEIADQLTDYVSGYKP